MPDQPKHLLLVEDESQLRQVIAEQLGDRGYRVEQAATGEAALTKLSEFAFDVIVTDLRLPGIDGSAVVDAALERYPDIVAIVVTGYGTLKDAVAAIKRGAWDFVSKPFQIDELTHVLDSAIEQRRLKSENAYLRAQLDERHRFEGLIGKSGPMIRLFQLLELVAATSSTTLITGETGTGKEVVARAIHHSGSRRGHRFVALNCSAIPETLLEAEIFGHVRGAFTGAVGNRQGRLEQAHKGTLFLDEVGTMSPALQMKLLRVLQEREFERVGDSHTIKVDVRVIAATNSDLGRLVAEGQFREDLFYRLNVIPVQLPPLRDRKEDIPLLVQHFLDKYQAASQTQDEGVPGAKPSSGFPAGPAGRPGAPTGRPTPLTVSQQAMRRLMSYQWPGNVRQLENAIERAVAFGTGRVQIDVADLPIELLDPVAPAIGSLVSLPEEGLDLLALVSSIERELIERSLDRTNGNKGQAARLLNLKRTTLVERLKRLQK
jgi:DNA-binding NtrC family response regulator